MTQLKLLLKRLKNPAVLMSIVSEVVMILLAFHVDIDKTAVMGIATAVCSVLTTLGILSNPSSEKKGYADDIYVCETCGKKCLHAKIKDKMVCTECGNEKTP